MQARLVSTVVVGAVLSVVPAIAASRDAYRPASKVPIFVGGDSPGWKGTIHSYLPGALEVHEIPADVGYVREIPAEFKTDGTPFGVARELTWSGRSRARYVFRNRWASGYVSDSRRSNTFLVFNLKVLENGGSDLRVLVQSGSCTNRHRLRRSDLAAEGLWKTYRIPISEFRPCAGDLERNSVAFENEALVGLTIDIADLRWETYPQGWTFAESLSEDLLRGMTVPEKIGQMAQMVHRAGSAGTPVFPVDVARLKLGSLFGDSGAPPHDERGNPLPDTPEIWFDFLNSYQRAALGTDKAIPILLGMDAVHGLALVPGATIFPHNIGLGATGNENLLEAIGRATALEASALGFRLTFAPTLAVARDERWGRTYESLSELPWVVSWLGTALGRGYQGTRTRYDLSSLSSPGSILATAKHFGGDGAGTFADPGEFCMVPNTCAFGTSIDRTNSDLDEDALIALHLAPYISAIESGVGAVMSSDSSWKGNVVTGSRRLLTEVLKEKFGFGGILITDYESWAKPIPSDPEASMLATLNAGHDLVMLPSEDGYAVLEQSVQNGLAARTLSEDRVNDAVRRILQKKFELGLFDIPYAQRALFKEIGSAAHHALAREAVRQSLVLLKNQPAQSGRRKVLPLSRTSKIYVAGKAANDIGIQAGGWTDVWQGVVGNSLPGSTVLQGIQQLATGTVVHSPDASAEMAGSDVGVVVVGEYPYAEFCGDVLGKTFFCEFSRPNPAGLIRALPEFPLPLGLPPPQTMRLTSSSFDYYSPFIEGQALPVTVDPVSDLDVITKVCSKMPCVVVLLSGRPLFIDDALQQADAFVAAWLPGAEGAGVADVLYADRGADFSGRLTHTWPRTPRDPNDAALYSSNPELDYVPQNAYVYGNGNLTSVLFPIGYGLSYRR